MVTFEDTLHVEALTLVRSTSAAWDHFNHAARLSLVTKPWLRPSQSVLYRSISLRGFRQATLFARTAHARPDLASRVRWLSLGLGDALEMTIPECGQVAASLALVAAAELCPHVLHFHFRPMAEAAREALKAFLGARELESIVVAPRAADPLAMAWYQGLTQYGDFVVPALSALTRLEGDMYCLPPADFGQMMRELRAFTYPPMQIRLLRFDSDMPTAWLLKLIKATGPTLEVLDIYHEQAIDVDEAYDALLAATKSLVRLRWRVNPFLSPEASSQGSRSPSPAPPALLPPSSNSLTIDTQLGRAPGSATPSPLSASSCGSADTRPLFDRLLPRFERLERLYTSSDSITVTLVGVTLPEKLRHIEIQAFEGEGVNRPVDHVQAIAQAPPVAPQSREVGLTFVGNKSLWTEQVSSACCLGDCYDFLLLLMAFSQRHRSWKASRRAWRTEGCGSNTGMRMRMRARRAKTGRRS